MRPTLVLLSILLPAAAYLLPPPARAAQSYDSCTGFIDSLPAVIGTQGTWCLRKDLSTAMTSGSAITIAANNVTIDCNDFKIGGLVAGNISLASGVYANARQNISVRNCNLRGFLIGIVVSGGSGHQIDDNRIEGSLYMGILATGTNQSIRRNRILGTGRSADGGANKFAIFASGGVADNAVEGVFASGANATVWGIRLTGSGSVVRGNTVRGLRVMGGDGRAYGIYTFFGGNRIESNDMADADATASFGIYANENSNFCGHNTISGFQQAMAANCIDTGGNVDF